MEEQNVVDPIEEEGSPRYCAARTAIFIKIGGSVSSADLRGLADEFSNLFEEKKGIDGDLKRAIASSAAIEGEAKLMYMQLMEAANILAQVSSKKGKQTNFPLEQAVREMRNDILALLKNSPITAISIATEERNGKKKQDPAGDRP